MKRQKSKAKKIIGKIVLVLFLLLLTALAATGLWFYNNYGRELLELRSQAGRIAAGSTRDDFVSARTSICYYSDGSVMQILSGEKNVYYLPYNAIPGEAIDAMLAVEDRKFYSHKGYDVFAIIRAAKAYVENRGEIHQGGSTITQQLARLTYLTNEKTLERKVKEIFLAAALERKYSKNDILEFYLNNTYFANGYYGLQAAAKGYFNVTAGDLTLSQTAFLCGIPNSPSAYDPRKNFDNTIERRDRVLKQMYDTNRISEEEYKNALAEKITLVEPVFEKNNYEETYTYYCAIKAIMATEGFAVRYSFDSEEDEAAYNQMYYDEYSRVWRNLYAKGYRIYTSINPVKQEELQAAIDDELAVFTDKNEEGVYKLQASGVCIDNETGFVVAAVGGRYQEHVGYTLNRSYQSPRQPGSAIKPLIVYTPLFERGYYPDNRVYDERFDGGPRNSGDVYSGDIDIRYAVAASKNTIAWKLLGELGIETGLSYLKRMNFESIVDTDYYPAAALGGLTYGATAVEMTAGYAAIANDGIYRMPTCIIRITDTNGNVIIDNSPGFTGFSSAVNTMESKHIYEKNAANMMTDVLVTVMQSGTGRKLNLEGMTSAGKTGTTNNQKDGWFVGFTDYYTTGIWVGCDMPKAIDDLKGNTYPGRIWQAFMQKIHTGLEDRPLGGYVDNRPVEERYPFGWIDKDGDGIPDGYPDGWIDTDGDGFPDDYPEDWVDTDGDGFTDDYPEDWVDIDGDGIPDGYFYETEDTLDENEWVSGQGGAVWVEPGNGYVWVNPRDGSTVLVDTSGDEISDIGIPDDGLSDDGLSDDGMSDNLSMIDFSEDGDYPFDYGDEAEIEGGTEWYDETDSEIIWVSPRGR